MTEFIPGLRLCEFFYHEAVRPILDRRFPGLTHSAAKLDRGSDVLGFDTPQSTDHDWGPKAVLFLEKPAFEGSRMAIVKTLAHELPYEFRGFSTHFCERDVSDGHLESIDQGAISHGVNVTTVRGFFEEYVGVHPLEEIRPLDWLLIPQQRLRTITAGKVFHDGLRQLRRARDALAWYPRDVWLYLLACQWRRIDQEEPFMARCGDVGDELGSRVVAARLVNELMKLCFLMEKRYAPYYKWFGTAFSELECAERLTPVLHAVLASRYWRGREQALSTAYLHVARMHNELGIAESVEPKIWQFHNRPYQVPHSARFVDALYARIESESVRRLPKHVGGVSQFVDSTDVLDRVPRCRQLWLLYQQKAQPIAPAHAEPRR